MKHIGKVSVVRERAATGAPRGRTGTEPGFADAKTDFMNAIWRAWSDFVYQKKNEVSV
jgi:hypothetical protein